MSRVMFALNGRYFLVAMSSSSGVFGFTAKGARQLLPFNLIRGLALHRVEWLTHLTYILTYTYCIIICINVAYGN